MSEQVLIELIRLVPTVLWVVLAAILVGVFYRPIREELLPRMSGFKAWGFEVALLREDLDKAAEKQGSHIGRDERTRVLRRAEKVAPAVQGARILWVDDNPESNTHERRIVGSLGASIDIACSSGEARLMMSRTSYDLVISDMERDGTPDEGLRFLKEMRGSGLHHRVIFYIGRVNRDMGVPAHAFGISDRPDDLLHLVMDALERERV